MAGMLPQSPPGFFDRLAANWKQIDSPLEVARKLGLNVPTGRQAAAATMMVPEIIGPQADVKGMVYDAGQVWPQLQQGNFANALGHLGLAAAAIPMMALPGTVQSVKKGAQSMLPGAAPDRTEYSLLRYAPPRGETDRFLNLQNKIKNEPGAADEIKRIVKAGEKVGREWYDTEDLLKMFKKELGAEDGEAAWREYLTMVGATSTGSKVVPNLRNASYYFTGNKPGGGLPSVDELLAGAVPPKGSGYGHKMGKNQAKNIANYLSGKWGGAADPALNPKPRGFTQSLLGGHTNIAADKHFMRLMAMMSGDPAFLHTSAELSKTNLEKLRKQFGSSIEPFISERMVDGKPAWNFNAKAAHFGKKGNKKIKAAHPVPGVFDYIQQQKMKSAWEDMPNKTEYKSFEGMVNKLAKELNMTGPQLQASFWMGAAQDTGVAPSSQHTFMQIFNTILEQRAAERGLSKKQVFKNFANRTQPLMLPLAGASMLGAAGYEE